MSIVSTMRQNCIDAQLDTYSVADCAPLTRTESLNLVHDFRKAKKRFFSGDTHQNSDDTHIREAAQRMYAFIDSYSRYENLSAITLDTYRHCRLIFHTLAKCATKKDSVTILKKETIPQLMLLCTDQFLEEIENNSAL